MASKLTISILTKLEVIGLIAAFVLVFPTQVLANVVINEFLSNPTSPAKEWVEFYNPDNTDLESYWLDDDLSFTDDSGSSSKKSLATLNKTNPTYPYLEFSSFLNNGGDWVVLFTPEGTIVDQYQYTEDPGKDKSVGRSPDGTGDFTILSSATLGGSNSPPPPTQTPTPTPTPKPSPTPTPALKPTATPRSTSQSTSTKSNPSPAPSKTVSNQVATAISPSKSKTGEVLGGSENEEGTQASRVSEATLSLTVEPTATSTSLVVAGWQQNLPKIALIFGGLLLLGSGGLILFKKNKDKLRVEDKS